MATPDAWLDPEYRARLHDYANGTRTYPTTYCRDDAIAPGDTPFSCTKEQGHRGGHEAWGTDRSRGVYATWRRGEGKRNVFGV